MSEFILPSQLIFEELNPDSQNFKEIWKIYSSSFSPDERRNLKQQIELHDNSLYHFFALCDKNQLIGLMATWIFNEFIFIEHFAIKENLRSKGIGTKFLKEYIAKSNKNIVLEVERPEDDITKRRIKFYETLGFTLNRYNYIQPPYDKYKKAVPLFLMSYPKEISEAEFSCIRKQLYEVVYGAEKPF